MEATLVARISNEDIERTLRITLDGLGKQDHYSYCHPLYRPFTYVPSCPGCRVAILRALLNKKVIYG